MTDVLRKDLDPCIFFSQWLQRDASDWYRPTQRQAFSLWYVLDGRVELRRGDESYLLEAGDVGMTEPGMPATVQCSSSWYFLSFDVVEAPRIRRPHTYVIPMHREPQPSWAEITGFDLQAKIPTHYLPQTREMIVRVNERIGFGHLAWHQANAEFYGWLCAYMRLVCDASVAVDDTLADGNPLEMDFLTLAERRMRALAIRGQSVSAVAEHFGLSRSHFSDRYRQARGIGPGTFMRRVRLEQAMRLLEETKLPVSEVYQRAGFRSQRTCYERFQQELGCSPMEWRRRHSGDPVSE